MERKEFIFWKVLLLILGSIALIAILFGVTGCKSFKTVSSQTRDSVVIKLRDSVVISQHLRYKDSTVIKDTLVRVKHDRAEYRFPANSTKDTAIRSGRATLRISVNNGQVTGQADCDSFDILVTDLRILYRNEQTENQLLTKQLQDYKASHTELTVKTESKSWFGRLWVTLQRYFAWFGLIAFVYLIWRLFRWFTMGR